MEQIQFLLGHVSVQTTEHYLGCKLRIRSAVNVRIGTGRVADNPPGIVRLGYCALMSGKTRLSHLAAFSHSVESTYIRAFRSLPEPAVAPFCLRTSAQMCLDCSGEKKCGVLINSCLTYLRSIAYCNGLSIGQNFPVVTEFESLHREPASSGIRSPPGAPP